MTDGVFLKTSNIDTENMSKVFLKEFAHYATTN